MELIDFDEYLNELLEEKSIDYRLIISRKQYEILKDYYSRDYFIIIGGEE